MTHYLESAYYAFLVLQPLIEALGVLLGILALVIVIKWIKDTM